MRSLIADQLENRWITRSGREVAPKTVNFYRDEDADLLRWAETQGINFSDFTKHILRQAMEAEKQPAPAPQAAVTANQVRAIVRAELVALKDQIVVTTTPATDVAQPLSPPSEAVDDDLKNQLLSMSGL